MVISNLRPGLANDDTKPVRRAHASTAAAEGSARVVNIFLCCETIICSEQSPDTRPFTVHDSSTIEAINELLTTGTCPAYRNKVLEKRPQISIRQSHQGRPLQRSTSIRLKLSGRAPPHNTSTTRDALSPTSPKIARHV
jgi:hypothetical protein